MTKILMGTMVPFDFTPVDVDGNDQTLERPAVPSTSVPEAELIEVSENGLTGFVGNRTVTGRLACTFNIKGDGIKDNQEAFNIDHTEDLELVGASAVDVRGGFGAPVPIR